MVNIYHFYHIYADGFWQDPVSEHFKSMKVSGLNDALSSPIKIGLIGNEQNVDNVINFLKNNNFLYEVVDIKPYGWEQVTQHKLHNFSQSNEGYVLYAHTKSASNPHFPPNIPWRKTMTKYNVLNWKDCINKLNDGYDTAGIYWMNSPAPEHIGHHNFYAGTFWWTSLSFIRNLPPPNYEHRHRAEGWIGINEHIKPIKSFSFKGDGGWPSDFEELILE